MESPFAAGFVSGRNHESDPLATVFAVSAWAMVAVTKATTPDFISLEPHPISLPSRISPAKWGVQVRQLPW
jgi:hypothetical protein